MRQRPDESQDSVPPARRVLVVDDDSVLRTVYRLALTRVGYEVEEAADGESALQRLAGGHDRIALVVLDIGLPDIDGLELLATIREEHDDRSLPVIIVTGADGLAQRLDGLNGGANDYVAKSVALEELTARVDTQIRIAGHWQAQVSAAMHTRKQMALDLADISDDDDLSTAAEVITRSAARIGDVRGAAFLATDDLDVVSCVGDVPFEPNRPVPHRLGARLRSSGSEPIVADRAAFGLDGSGRMAVVPLAVSFRRVGAIVVTLAPGPATARSATAISTVADLAVIAVPFVEPVIDRQRASDARRRHHRRVIDELGFTTVFQPIVDLAGGTTVGYEALTRFADGTRPDLAFADAARAGLREPLEKAAAEAALVRAETLPSDAYLSINLSPTTALDTAFLAGLLVAERDVVIEITEHDAIDDYAELAGALASVRDRVRVAVDDAGAGYAGLTHMRSLRPDVIKLDRALVSGLEHDPVGRAMVAGMVHFARETGSALVGEGIETEDELRMLTELGVSHGQGYFLGAPAPPPGRTEADAA